MQAPELMEAGIARCMRAGTLPTMQYPRNLPRTRARTEHVPAGAQLPQESPKLWLEIGRGTSAWSALLGPEPTEMNTTGVQLHECWGLR